MSAHTKALKNPALLALGAVVVYYVATKDKANSNGEENALELELVGPPRVLLEHNAVRQEASSLAFPLRVKWFVEDVVENIRSTARGIRNKNPGNIRYNAANNWQGQTGRDDQGFAIFDSFANGVRAMGRIFTSYRNRGVVTLESIIATWAPTSENDTQSYINSVRRALGVPANYEVRTSDYPRLAGAIIKHENGINPFTERQLAEWIGAAPTFTAIS